MFSVDIFYPPQSPLTKGGSPVLPLTKGELEGVSHMFSVDIFYPPQSPLTKGGSPVLPLGKGGGGFTADAKHILSAATK
jgi:hypothetical protein